MRPILLLTTLLCALSAFAQHGTAASGVYPSDYHMDTFTGKLLDYNPETHEIRLQCDICAEKDEFVAIVGDPTVSKSMKFLLSPRDRDKSQVKPKVHKPVPDEITVGDLLRVYFNERESKQDGKKVKYNAVFEMEKLAEAAPPQPGAQP